MKAKTQVDRCEELIRELSRKYPSGEFICLPMYSYCGTRVDANVCWDWKLEITPFEGAPVSELVDFLQAKLDEN